MAFGGQSATAVPAPQRPNLARFCNRMWSVGRALRGYPTTALRALVLLALLASSSPASAQATAASPSPAPSPAAAASSEGWSRRLARSHYERAVTLDQRGDIAQALREYSESIAIDSTLGDAYLGLGALRERMGDAREAELVYSAALRLGDARARTLLQRSHLHRAAGHRAQALADLEASVELDASREALAELAHHYVEAQAWSAALATFRRIASLAQAAGDNPALETARLEVRALRVLAAETDPSTQRPKRHDWVGRALVNIARR